MTIVEIRSSLGRTHAANTDEVIASCPLPDGCRFLMGAGKCDLHYGTGLQAVTAVFYYGAAGVAVPIDDPDTNVPLDTLWDRFVTKDADWAEDGIDLDTNTGVTTPEFEPGEGNVFGVIDELNGVKQLMRRRRKLTAVGKPVFLDTTVKWWPNDSFAVGYKKPFMSRQHSMILFAVSNPELVDLTSTLPLMPAEIEWSMLKYADTMVEDAWKALTGLADKEAISITLPYETAMDFFGNLLEPDLVQDASSFVPTPATIHTTTDILFKISVPGDFRMKTLSSEN